MIYRGEKDSRLGYRANLGTRAPWDRVQTWTRIPLTPILGRPLEEDLASWGHHASSTTIPDAILQASAGEELWMVELTFFKMESSSNNNCKRKISNLSSAINTKI
ncbi:CHROMATIN REMODELING 25 protein [Nymphaea thermarum]|nr:CHROMATIN REMODELING 25 protein [Nymphaea thermarum]